MGTDRLLVSALTVTHGRPRFLEQAIRFFRAQTWPRKEMVIVDDSPKALRLNLSAAADIRYVTSDEVLDMGAKHDLAIEMAQGDALAYWDDDDGFFPRRILKQLEPIVLGKATITGIPREYVVHVPSGQFYKSVDSARRGPVRSWIGNGLAAFSLGFHDGTAMIARSALRHGIKHPPLRNGQKVVFLNSLVQAGEKWAAVRNEQLFVYCRHSTNTWQPVERKLFAPVPAPRWIPTEALDFWKGAA